ncbi:MAG: DNA double-strand break repair nuclease NurA [Candidatus Woesearchaeota archaeon]
MDELVKELKNIAPKRDIDDEYLLMNSRYIPLKIELKNFHEIPSKKSDKRILFVDGGSSILFESAGFCIGIIRIGGIVYSSTKRVKRSSEEFYILIKEINERYYITTYPETSFSDIAFNPEDESLKNGLEKCSISKIISIIRRFAEIDYAYKHSSDADYTLLDGTLEARYPLEEKYLEKLFATGKACALSKTCSLTTKNGLSIIKILYDMNEKSWYYHPIIINNNSRHGAEIYFVKLHEKSRYVFRFEVQKNFSKDIEELLSEIYMNSKDPIFLGYPYGLIDVDQYARVSDEESELLRTKMSMRLGKDWSEFSRHLNSMNAHSILDKIKF